MSDAFLADVVPSIADKLFIKLSPNPPNDWIFLA